MHSSDLSSTLQCVSKPPRQMFSIRSITDGLILTLPSSPPTLESNVIPASPNRLSGPTEGASEDNENSRSSSFIRNCRLNHPISIEPNCPHTRRNDLTEMVEFAPHDRLVEALKAPDRYPFTLLKSTTSKALLQEYHDYLREHNAKLFGGRRQRIVFWELWPGAQSIHPLFVSVHR